VAKAIAKGASMIALVVLLIAALCAVLSIATYYLWNWLMPEIFGLTTITYVQALGINFLCWILFKGTPKSNLLNKNKEG